MARHSRNAEATANKNKKEADFTLVEDTFSIDFYVDKDKKKIKAYIRAGLFLIKANVRFNDDYCFIAYPSFKGKDGKYIEQAYCYDKDTVSKINGFIEMMLDELKW